MLNIDHQPPCFNSTLKVNTSSPSSSLASYNLQPLCCVVPLPGRGRGRRGPNVQSSGDHKARSELKTKDQIMKQRKKKQKHQFLQGGGMRKLRSKNKKWLGEVKKSGFGRGGHKKGKLRKKLWGGQRVDGVEDITRNWVISVRIIWEHHQRFSWRFVWL